jgi:hypothetical protein
VPACPALACGVLIAALSPLALATPYWVAFEGDTMPEEQPGWVRHWSGQYGGAQRWIETDPDGNNYLVIDSLASQMIYDYAQMDRQIDPGPSELFVADWRVLISEQYGYYNDGIAFCPDTGGTLAFLYKIDQVRSEREGWTHSFTPGVFHSYHLESWSMVSYKLWIDGILVRDGFWDLNSLNQSYVAFGDGGQGGGARSLAKWDYVRFGVVPEPGVLVLLAVCACDGRRRHRV